MHPLNLPSVNLFIHSTNHSSIILIYKWINANRLIDKIIFIFVIFLSIELASLTHSQLLEKIQALQTFAYQLGIEEGMAFCSEQQNYL